MAVVPSMVVIPGLKTNKNSSGKLLRKPRAPQPLPQIPITPIPNSANTKVLEYFESIDFDTDFTSPQHTGTHQSPTPSVVPSLASPPPPSESNARRSHLRTQYASPQSRISYLSREEKKYMLDPLFREHTSLGTYVDGKSLVKPYKPRGPDGLPIRPPRRHPEVVHGIDIFDDIRFYSPPAFTLDNFLIHISEVHRVPLRKAKEAICSRHNYNRLTKLIAQNEIYPAKQGEVHLHYMTPEGQSIPPAEPRIPQKQLLIEMASMIKQHVREVMNTEVKSVIKPIKKYSPSYEDGAAPHTEIILVEDDSREVASRKEKIKQESEMPAKDAMFQSAATKYFQGSQRSHSPFAGAAEGMISPSELAILDTLISAGKALSLKAHFISELPDISPLAKTITYLNLSFNDLSLFPVEVLNIRQLEVLKLRNNPLRELPKEIHKLRNLRTLVASFCLIQSLPISLFSLEKLVHLDISYNRVSFIQNEISNLQNLRELNLEGNQLPAMPCGALRLTLDMLNVKNNFMHPLFWKENAQNEPQRLQDLSALTLHKYRLDRSPDLPKAVHVALRNSTVCDCCNGTMFGPGLRIIRPVTSLFGIKNLPFMFRACSTSCLKDFRHSKETLSEILYGKGATTEVYDE